ncbi:MAG TPA: protease pro-enzyme activation domain-containing protein, partial [Streptosporangiaceae bacterium]
MVLSFRLRLWAGLAAGVLVAAPVAATADAAQASSTPGPNTPQQVPTGILAPALPGASAFGDTAPNTPEQVSFILKERNLSQLESAVTGGLTSFNSVSLFAASYGQTPGAVSAVTSYLASFGIETTVYPGNVDVSASGTAKQFDKALSVTQKNYHVPAQHGPDGTTVRAQTVRSATGAPDLPYSVGQYVLTILGLTNYSPFVSHVAHTSASVTPTSSASGDQPGNFLPSDFA